MHMYVCMLYVCNIMCMCVCSKLSLSPVSCCYWPESYQLLGLENWVNVVRGKMVAIERSVCVIGGSSITYILRRPSVCPCNCELFVQHPWTSLEVVGFTAVISCTL